MVLINSSHTFTAIFVTDHILHHEEEKLVSLNHRFYLWVINILLDIGESCTRNALTDILYN